MSNDTTQIDLLPSNSSSTGTPDQNTIPVQSLPSSNNSENVKIQNYGQQLNQQRQVDTASHLAPIDYTSQLTNVLKDAQASGATVLPSKDIPQQTLEIQQDFQTKPDYVPESTTNDYIGNILDKEKIILQNKIKQNHSDNLDFIYQKLQMPVLVGIIYFIFQLPIIRKNLLTFLPNLFNKDGNPKLSGYIFNSVIFASIYGILVKGLDYLQN